MYYLDIFCTFFLIRILVTKPKNFYKAKISKSSNSINEEMRKMCTYGAIPGISAW